MTTAELQTITPSGETFAEIKATMPNGTVDPVCIMTEGEAPKNADEEALFIVARDGDSFRSRLGTIEIDNPESDEPQMVIEASRTLIEKPKLMGVVVQAALEHAEVERVVIDIEEGTNIPEKILKKAGAIALGAGEVQFQLDQAA
jgi:hypothetical protein